MTPTTIIDRFDGEYAFLSNFYDAPVTYNGLTFLNSEAAFQAQKEPERAQEFTKLTPGKAKVLGRHVTMREDWNNVRIEVMREIVRAKFAQHPELAEKLVETGTATLIEGNYWHDYFWGVCNGKGENHLGKILMDVREELMTCSGNKETIVRTRYCPEEMKRQEKKPYLLRVREVYSDSFVVWASDMDEAHELAEELCNSGAIDVTEDTGRTFETREVYCDDKASTTDIQTYHHYATEETYTWDDIYVRADGCAYGDDALTAKDNARWELGCLIEDMMGFDIEDCECPEEEIDKFLNEHSELNIRFDIDGHIVEK